MVFMKVILVKKILIVVKSLLRIKTLNKYPKWVDNDLFIILMEKSGTPFFN